MPAPRRETRRQSAPHRRTKKEDGVTGFPALDFRTLIEQLPVVTYAVELHEPKRVTYVSPQVQAVMGYTPAEYRANRRIWPQRIDARDRPAVLAALARSRTAGEPLVCDYRFRHRDGRMVLIHDEATIVCDTAGRPISMQGIMQDVTERRRAEALLDFRARQQAAVARLGQAAIAGRDLDALLDCATSLICETLEVDYAHILERRSGGDFIVRSGAGWHASPVGTVAVGGADSQAGLTLASERPTIMSDWGPERRRHMSPHLDAHHVVSGVTVIVGAAARPYGVLGAYTTAERRFTADDVNFLQGISNILAAAVGRIRGQDLRDHLMARAISAHEEERTRIARELHDETGQALSAILVGLRNLEHIQGIAEARILAHRLRDLTAQTVRDVGRLARGLRPSVLDDLGLLPALQRYGEELGASHQLAVRIVGDDAARFPPNVETTLYRIVQEALTNVARHARAQSADVSIRPDNRAVLVVIRDDGAGFDVNSALETTGSRRSLGLMGMQERASLLGGRMSISSKRGAGTSVTVEIPLDGAA
jgi:PAS domain S-box-containing protein